MRQSFCIIFDSKRSRTFSRTKVDTIRQAMLGKVAGCLPIVPYESVKHLPIYDAVDIAAGFCTFKK